MPENLSPKSRPPDEGKVDMFIEVLRQNSPEELQKFDIRLTRRGGKFAMFAALLRGDLGDLEDEETQRRFREEVARLDKLAGKQ